MPHKPTDYFLNALEFFGVLIPGAIGAYALIRLAPEYVEPITNRVGSGTEAWIVFAVAALVLGYLVQKPAGVLDILYDHTYRKYQRRRGDSLFEAARALAGEEAQHVYDWARDQVEAADARFESTIGRLQGISKLFRSICLYALIATPLLALRGERVLAIALGILAVGSFFIFSERRWAGTQYVYRRLLEVGEERSAPSTKSIEIRTSGDQSPGIVEGDYTINTINQTIVREFKEAKQKRWRDLSIGNWLALNKRDSGMRLPFDVCEALRLAFAEQFQDFTFLLRVTDLECDGQQERLFQIICHKSAFTAALQDVRGTTIRIASRAADSDAAKSELVSEFLEKEDLLKGWTHNVKISVPDGLAAVRCVYEPEFKRIRLESQTDASLDPAEYPDHLSTTSECLRFVATAIGSVSLAHIGNIAWYADDYRLQKMLVDLIDTGSVDIARLRVNTNDDEDWDYVNPKYDAEVRGYT